MSFQSIFFLPFVILTLILFFKVRPNHRWVVILTGSLFFYISLGFVYLLIPLMTVILVSYWVGKKIGITSETREKKHWFLFGTVTNLSVLVFFRYFPILGSQLLPPDHKGPLIVAIGVSFYVFQAVSYLIDIYLDKLSPENHLGYFACYISFFPKLLQGPIERGEKLLPQLRETTEFSYENARKGALLFTYGLFKKIAVADRLGVIVDTIFGNMDKFSGPYLLLAVIGYSFQLYYDFSGYTDMARGVAWLFNIDLTQNFNLPYLSRTVSDFWRRWHISFSRWILDYIFTPIQLSLRKWGVWGGVVAILITFGVSGIWHGATLGYFIWGLLHGLYLSIEMVYRPYRTRLYRWLRIEKTWLANSWQTFITFSLVTFSWIFFRANSLREAFWIVKKTLPWNLLASPEGECGITIAKRIGKWVLHGTDLASSLTTLNDTVCVKLQRTPPLLPELFREQNNLLTIAAIFLVIWIGLFGRRMNLLSKPAWVRWTVYFAMISFILAAGLFFQPYTIGAAPYLYFKY